MRPRKPPPRPPEPDTSPKKVVVTRSGQYVTVVPPVVGLRNELYSVTHVTDPVTGAVVRKPVPLLRDLMPPFPTGHLGRAGLEPVIVDGLLMHGHEVELSGARLDPLEDPDLAWHGRRGGPVDEPLLEFVGRRERGLVRYDDTTVDPAVLVLQAARAWPKALTLATTSMPAAAAELGRRLRDGYARTRVVGETPVPSGASRLLVACDGRLGDGKIDLGRVDFWFSLDPWRLFSTWNTNAVTGLNRAVRSRMFGLAPMGFVPSPGVRTLLESVYGRDELVVRAHGGRPRPVDVVFLPVTGAPLAGNASLNPHVLKRDGIWGHPVRNRRIARLLRLLRAGDVGGIRAEFPQLAAVSDERLGGRVCVRVENLDHAEALLGRADWLPLVCDRPPAGTEETHPRVVAARRRRASRAKVFMAVGGAATFDPPADILVNADSAAAVPPRLPGDYGGPAAGRLLIVDFRDKQHPLLRHLSRRREQAYADEGCEVAGRAVRSPWERFLERRPDVDADALAAWQRGAS